MIASMYAPWLVKEETQHEKSIFKVEIYDQIINIYSKSLFVGGRK